jgi:hypothetical protein
MILHSVLSAPSAAESAAFRNLSRALARRRLQGAGARLRVVLLAIAAIVGAFTYWQVRIPLDGLHRNQGSGAATLMLGAVLGAFALAAAAATAGRQAAMRANRPGPEWLALPAPPALVVAHLASEARLPALTLLPLAIAALAAGAGLVPPAALAALGAAFALAWEFATRAAATLARRTAPAGRPAERALPPDASWLVAEPRRTVDTRRPASRWRRGTPLRALVALDALSTRRASRSRARAVMAGVFAMASVLVWAGSAEPLVRRTQAFALLLPAATALGAWAIHRACAAPADLHRPLPISLRDAWLARAIPLAVVAFALAAANALAAAALPAAARAVMVPAWGLVAFAVSVLGLHYGLTLVPRGDAAETVYTSWLAAAITASVMIPLLGWFVLAGGLVHSSLRLRRWWEPEAVR